MLLILFIALPIRGVVAACVIGSIASWLGFDSVLKTACNRRPGMPPRQAATALAGAP